MSVGGDRRLMTQTRVTVGGVVVLVLSPSSEGVMAFFGVEVVVAASAAVVA